MTSATFVLLSGLLTFGVPLAIAIRELRGLGVSSNRGDGPPPPEVMPLPRKPLPACLLPRPVSLNDRQFIYELADA
jgi:hypothetical protein